MLTKPSNRNIRKRFFIKNFLLFLIPALLTLIIIGVLSFRFSYNEVKQYVEENNISLLDSAINNIEKIMKDMEYININLSSNSSIKTRLKRILSNTPIILTVDDYTAFRTILDMIFVSANSNKYVYSIYIYFESAKDIFIASTEKQIYSLSDSSDRSWYDSYISFKDKTVSSWAALRSMEMSSGKSKRLLLTLFNRMYTTITGKKEPDGVLVLNLYADSINKLFDSIVTSPEQILLVTDENNQKIFGSLRSSGLSDSDIASINAGSLYVSSKGEKYVITQKKFTRFNWNFILLVPYKTLYRIPNQIVISMILGLMLSVLGSVAFAIYNTKKAYKNFCSLLTIIESTQKGESVADIHPPGSSNEYTYIIHNLLKTFIEHDYLRVQLSEKKYKMQALELQAMQAQMNPHFLLNTMEIIYWKTMNESRTPNVATALIGDISSILQYSLYNPMQLVCLLEEIEIAKSYLNIQGVRHKDEFVVEWDYDPMLVEYRINKLILQPILENTIYHGQRDKNHELRIRVKIYRHESGIRISVSDNGKGIPADRLAEIRESLNKDSTDFSQHIGLYNTNKRLILMHGRPYGLKIFSVQNIGTVIYMDTPLIS